MMIKWEKVRWDNSKEFMNIVMDDHIYFGKNINSTHAYYSGKDLSVKAVGAKNTIDDLIYFVLQGRGYIKKEADWFDVVSKDRPMLMKDPMIGVIFSTENHKGNCWRPATLEEVKSMTWECMKDE